MHASLVYSVHQRACASRALGGTAVLKTVLVLVPWILAMRNELYRAEHHVAESMKTITSGKKIERVTYLQDVVPIKHCIWITRVLGHIHCIADHEPEAGLQEVFLFEGLPGCSAPMLLPVVSARPRKVLMAVCTLPESQ